MSAYDINGHPITMDTSKEVWVDNYNSIADAIADGDIINFTNGKTYEIDASIVINKQCWLKGNGCILHADPVEAVEATTNVYWYMFDIKHDNVVIDGFNAYSENMYPWQNGGIVYPNTITSNVYFLRISASNVYVSNINTNHLCGAVRIADESSPEAFSYHDVSIENIVCLDGVINVYIGNVIRCTANNLMLSTNEHNDTLGHAVYISRGVKHVAVSNFVIYNNYGQFGGISIHPSSSRDSSLTSYVAISNGTIRSIAYDSFAFQITHAEHITINNVICECINGAKSVYMSGATIDVAFNGCVLKGDNAVVRQYGYMDQRQIFFNDCTFECVIKQTDFCAMIAVQGATFNSCVFYVRKDTSGTLTAPSGYLLSTYPSSTSKDYAIGFYNCTIKVADDVSLNLLKDLTTTVNDVFVDNCVFESTASPSTLIDGSLTYYSVMHIHNIIAKNYGAIVPYDANGTLLSNVLIDDLEYAKSVVEFNVLKNTSKKGKIIGKFPNIVTVFSTSGLVAIAVLTYSVSTVFYMTSQISGVNISKSANSDIFTVTNNLDYTVSVAVK